MRRSARDGALVRVSGCDPLNLVGISCPGARVPALRTYEVTYKDGIVVGEVEEAAGA